MTRTCPLCQLCLPVGSSDELMFNHQRSCASRPDEAPSLLSMWKCPSCKARIRKVGARWWRIGRATYAKLLFKLLMPVCIMKTCVEVRGRPTSRVISVLRCSKPAAVVWRTKKRPLAGECGLCTMVFWVSVPVRIFLLVCYWASGPARRRLALSALPVSSAVAKALLAGDLRVLTPTCRGCVRRSLSAVSSRAVVPCLFLSSRAFC